MNRWNKWSSLDGFWITAFVGRFFVAGVFHCGSGAYLVSAAALQAAPVAEKQDGYRGLWGANQASGDDYKFTYAGGLGTYTANHVPMAVYAPAVNKTFFVYGGTKPRSETNRLLEMVSYFDHATGMVPRPTVVMEKGTDDPHHNPALSLDREGYLWVFCSAHGGSDGFIYRSRKPYSIEGFDLVAKKEFTYPQIWHAADGGFVFLFTKYSTEKGKRGQRELFLSTSRDGRTWTPDRKYAGFGGHYQSSWQKGKRIGTAFNRHLTGLAAVPGVSSRALPPSKELVIAPDGPNARTDLYYLETVDDGATWTNAAGQAVTLPLASADNPALVQPYSRELWLVYVNDVNFDAAGRPVIFYVLSKGYRSGPMFGERLMMTAHWTGTDWRFSEVGRTDHNYDMGSLYIEPGQRWRIVVPTVGPQAWSTGGEVGLWESADQGRTWAKVRDLTEKSPFNHHYVKRPVDAHPGFHAFWADGDALEPSDSRLYFADRSGGVHVLPYVMEGQSAAPADVILRH